MEQKNLELAKVGLLALITVFVGINTFTGGGGHAHDDGEEQVANDFANPNAHAGHDHNADNPFGNQNNSQLSPEEQAKLATQPPPGPPTVMTFAEMEHDFGNINQDSENKHSFTFKNEGSNPLLISNAAGSCGCTVPSYPKEPIPPGGTATIDVVYSPGKQELQQQKEVTLTANTNPPTTVLKIKAFVEPGTGDPATKELTSEGGAVKLN